MEKKNKKQKKKNSLNTELFIIIFLFSALFDLKGGFFFFLFAFFQISNFVFQFLFFVLSIICAVYPNSLFFCSSWKYHFYSVSRWWWKITELLPADFFRCNLRQFAEGWHLEIFSSCSSIFSSDTHISKRYLSIYLPVYLSSSEYISLCAYLSYCLSLSVLTRTHTHTCVCVCVCVCIDLFIYICLSINTYLATY